jgi:parallel beta-helix repeat protein
VYTGAMPGAKMEIPGKGLPRPRVRRAIALSGSEQLQSDIRTKGRCEVRTLTASALVVGLLLGFTAAARAKDISGIISATLTLTDESELTGNVSCTVVGAPCIAFRASNIKLRLNGFTVTGLADPVTGCGGAGPTLGEDGIDTGGQSHVEIEGPGLVRRFRNHGINISGGIKNQMDRVTVSTNCNVGIHLAASDSDVEDNTATRNSSIATAPCGGIEVGGNNNRVRRNELSGNGLRFPFIDFGIAVFGKNNLIEENSAVGNVRRGIILFAGATGNLLVRNTALGNPPLQVSVFFPDTPLIDMDDLNPAGANTFIENHCEVGIGGASNACPSFPGFAGHHNSR